MGDGGGEGGVCWGDDEGGRGEGGGWVGGILGMGYTIEEGGEDQRRRRGRRKRLRGEE